MRDTKTFDLLIKWYLEREDQLKDDLHSLFYVILGQYNKAIAAKLESINRYATQAAQGNCLWLLQHIRATMNQFDSGQYPTLLCSKPVDVFTTYPKAGRPLLNIIILFRQSMIQSDYYMGGHPRTSIWMMGYGPVLQGKEMPTNRPLYINGKLLIVSFWVQTRVVLENCNMTYRTTSPVERISSPQH